MSWKELALHSVGEGQFENIIRPLLSGNNILFHSGPPWGPEASEQGSPVPARDYELFFFLFFPPSFENSVQIPVPFFELVICFVF